VSVLAGCALCVPVDSLLWGRPVLAELEMLHFNVFLNKSSEWGTSPFHWYFTSALPKAMVGNLVLLPLAYKFVPSYRPHTNAALLFVLLYSVLPHKELRFIFYVLPMFHAHIALLLAGILHNGPLRLREQRLGTFFLLFCLNMAVSGTLHHISSLNYPGGHALTELHKIEGQQRGVVHLDTLTCMTGSTRFLKIHGPSWTYNKDPSVFTINRYAYGAFTHSLASLKLPYADGKHGSIHDNVNPPIFKEIRRITAFESIDWVAFITLQDFARIKPAIGLFRKKEDLWHCDQPGLPPCPRYY